MTKAKKQQTTACEAVPTLSPFLGRKLRLHIIAKNPEKIGSKVSLLVLLNFSRKHLLPKIKIKIKIKRALLGCPGSSMLRARTTRVTAKSYFVVRTLFGVEIAATRLFDQLCTVVLRVLLATAC